MVLSKIFFNKLKNMSLGNYADAKYLVNYDAALLRLSCGVGLPDL